MLLSKRYGALFGGEIFLDAGMIFVIQYGLDRLLDFW